MEKDGEWSVGKLKEGEIFWSPDIGGLLDHELKPGWTGVTTSCDATKNYINDFFIRASYLRSGTLEEAGKSELTYRDTIYSRPLKLCNITVRDEETESDWLSVDGRSFIEVRMDELLAETVPKALINLPGFREYKGFSHTRIIYKSSCGVFRISIIKERHKTLLEIEDWTGCYFDGMTAMSNIPFYLPYLIEPGDQNIFHTIKLKGHVPVQKYFGDMLLEAYENKGYKLVFIPTSHQYLAYYCMKEATFSGDWRSDKTDTQTFTDYKLFIHPCRLSAGEEIKLYVFSAPQTYKLESGASWTLMRDIPQKNQKPLTVFLRNLFACMPFKDEFLNQKQIVFVYRGRNIVTAMGMADTLYGTFIAVSFPDMGEI